MAAVRLRMMIAEWIAGQEPNLTKVPPAPGQNIHSLFVLHPSSEPSFVDFFSLSTMTTSGGATTTTHHDNAGEHSTSSSQRH